MVTYLLEKREFLYVVAFFIFILGSTYITWPLVIHSTEYVTGYGDELIIAWIQNWVIHALQSNISSLFTANTFYPFINSLAYSDLFFTSSTLSFLPRVLTDEPIVVINVTLITSLTLLGFSVFALSYYLTRDYLSSLLAGIIVLFSPAVIDKKVHLQILSIYFVPLALLFFIHFLKTFKYKYLLMSFTCFILQTFNSFMPGYFIVFSYIIILLIFLLYKKIDVGKLFNKKTLLIYGAVVLALLPIIIPYYQVSLKYNAKRDIRDAIHFALQPEDLIYPNDHTRLQPFLIAVHNTFQYSPHSSLKPGFIGSIFTFLGIITIIYCLRTIKRKYIYLQTFVLISVVGLILSFGPALHIGRQTIHNPFPIILPYALLYYIAPGFQGFRNSARWEMLYIIGLAVAISLFLSNISRRLSMQKRIFIYTSLLLLAILEYNFPMKFFEAPQSKSFPDYHKWLVTTPKATQYVELPIYNWYYPHAHQEFLRQFYSTIHFRRSINGASGFGPEEWVNINNKLNYEFPSDETIRYLKSIGIDYVIVHEKEIENLVILKSGFSNKHVRNGSTIVKELSKFKNIKLVKTFDSTYVYKL